MMIFREHRLIFRGDVGQLWEDVKDRHVRTDGVGRAAGSLIMAPAALLAKGPSAIIGSFSQKQAEPLPEGVFAYTGRDVRSAIGNTLGGIVTFDIGRVGRGILDAGDAVTTSPLLDIGSSLFGHTRKKIGGMFAENTSIYHSAA